jgi:hypothetical protein
MTKANRTASAGWGGLAVRFSDLREVVTPYVKCDKRTRQVLLHEVDRLVAYLQFSRAHKATALQLFELPEATRLDSGACACTKRSRNKHRRAEMRRTHRLREDEPIAISPVLVGLDRTRSEIELLDKDGAGVPTV